MHLNAICAEISHDHYTGLHKAYLDLANPKTADAMLFYHRLFNSCVAVDFRVFII